MVFLFPQVITATLFTNIHKICQPTVVPFDNKNSWHLFTCISLSTDTALVSPTPPSDKEAFTGVEEDGGTTKVVYLEG